MKRPALWTGLGTAFWLWGMAAAAAEGVPASGFYTIISGAFVSCCGFAGVPLSRPLPSGSQACIEVRVDAASGTARMQVLGADMRTVFVFPQVGPQPVLALRFDRGQVLPDRLRFEQMAGPEPGSAFWSYTLAGAGDTLSLNGWARLPCPGCADVPTDFTHTNVVARRMPEVTLRVSEVEVRWEGSSNRLYQVQYQSEETGAAWVNLGPPVPGVNGPQAVVDRVRAEEARRFYRVVTLP